VNRPILLMGQHAILSNPNIPHVQTQVSSFQTAPRGFDDCSKLVKAIANDDPHIVVCRQEADIAPILLPRRLSGLPPPSDRLRGSFILSNSLLNFSLRYPSFLYRLPGREVDERRLWTHLVVGVLT
jgi:hypothetical protein